MAIPKFFDFFRPVLEQLSDGKVQSIGILREKVAAKMGITEAEKAIMIPSGKQPTYANRITWAVVYLKKAGLVSSPSRAKYMITKSGKNALDQVGLEIDLQFLENSDEFRAFRYGTNNENDTTTLTEQIQMPMNNTPEDSMEKAFNEMNSMLADELLNAIMELKPKFFERLVVELLIKMGYGGAFEDSGMVVGSTNDEGIDGIIREDKLGFSNIYIQAKRWNPTTVVSRPEIQQFVGALAGQAASKGLFITTAQFSKGAKDYAMNNTYTTKVVLVDGKMLAKLMIENGVGVSTVNTYEIKKLDNDYFYDEND